MKNLWMLVALFSLTIGAKANHYGSTIVIKSQGDAPIIVEMDRRHSPHHKPVHKFNNIRPGKHFVEVYRRTGHHPHAGHHPPRLVYRGYVRAQQGYRSVYVIRHGSLRLVSKKRLSHGNHGCSIHGNQSCNCNSGPHGWNNGSGHQGHGNGHGGYGGYGNGHGNGYNGHGYGNGHSGGDGNVQGYSGGCNNSCGHSNGHSWNNWNNNWNGNYGHGGQHWNGNSGYYGGHQPMSYQDFWFFMNRMRGNLTDAQKVDMAKRELKDDWLTTEQVNIVLDDLFFEQEKLDLAKNLYHRTVDPDEYKELDNQFDFNSNKKQLSEYVERNAPK